MRARRRLFAHVQACQRLLDDRRSTSGAARYSSRQSNRSDVELSELRKDCLARTSRVLASSTTAWEAATFRIGVLWCGRGYRRRDRCRDKQVIGVLIVSGLPIRVRLALLHPLAPLKAAEDCLGPRTLLPNEQDGITAHNPGAPQIPTNCKRAIGRQQCVRRYSPSGGPSYPRKLLTVLDRSNQSSLQRIVK
jgi:hypothetical protein